MPEFLRSLKNLLPPGRLPVPASLLAAVLGTATLAMGPMGRSPAELDLLPAADDGQFLHLSGCSLSTPVISPPRTETEIRFSVIGSEPVRVQVAVYSDSTQPKLGDLQPYDYRSPRTYVVPFDGIIPGEIENRVLEDGDYLIGIRAVSDTGRVEQCFLPLEIDRVPPRILRFDVNGDTARTVTVKNGDTIVVDAYMDRPSYGVAADFSRVDNDAPASNTQVLDQGGGRYTIRHFISAANTLPDGTALPVTLTFTDLAGNVLNDSSLRFCLSNRPPRLLSARLLNNDEGLVRNGSTVRIETVWDSSDTLLTVTGDFGGIDSQFAPGNVTVSRFTGNRYEIHYPISGENTREDAAGYLVTFQARDRGCGISATQTLALTLDNVAGTRPVLDPLPISTRSATVAVAGTAPGNHTVQIKRNGTVVDTVLVGENGRFSGTAKLVSGVNTITAEGYDPAGNKTAAAISQEITYLTGAFVTIPRRFTAGSAIELGLPRTGASARVEIWNLAGDLLTAIEDTSSRDLYRLAWDGRNSSGETVGAGPVISVIEVTYPDGKKETMREAFVLVKP